MTVTTMWAKRLSSSYSWTNVKKPGLMQIITSEVFYQATTGTICPAAASQEVSNERERLCSTSSPVFQVLPPPGEALRSSH